MHNTKDTTNKAKAFKRIDTTFVPSCFKHFSIGAGTVRPHPNASIHLNMTHDASLQQTVAIWIVLFFGEGVGPTRTDGQTDARRQTRTRNDPRSGSETQTAPCFRKKSPEPVHRDVFRAVSFNLIDLLSA